MKNLYYTFGILMMMLFIGIDSQAQDNKAKFRFQKEKHNFGDIAEGPKVSTEFEFTNTGKEPMVLSNVTASCGCTTPHWPKEPIMPGATGKIVVEYNTENRPGRFSKMITIHSNADEAEKRVFIEGNVIPAKTVDNTVPEEKKAPEQKKPVKRPY